ncbi:MAG: ferrochelatase [Stygiobacter sp. RIFOXYC12_FULL_38_8]|nr:MAG: ferrochelatase [Stygiobacter sp. GWC2_38_9]OGV07283.1 MAG: ferrochelatase [Stygiobacter sp. RIFOXYB2_FULL_37_11]OGV10982.1 MAG: ferrochelatase [Stygiobacter sp. RIFOXYA2_FULL_38_8]OGV15816.1 MAG: ferrochelatase [Stygiobacter sp. RIFOXYC2_FULL_38_25]OGV29217.1 MAG: ferrochelatase [Stygiobacter sp. RIFOXYC12_FULL_38_8]OGV80930.1 MAG: ferrochelatase [Stygiobacter sp. GWF2_38_21]OGV89714.1 MAG: ferrochelatase [Melioribacter sp. RIFOXYB12_FULL_38_5]
MKIAVVLFNLGGPDSLEAIEPFLFNLFSDRDIFKLPFGQKTFAKFISSRRAPKVAGEYKLIGGKSPINMWTEEQRQILQKLLRFYHKEIDVYTAMRYWKPLTQEAVDKVEDGDYDKIILLPLYPHYSITTTGSSYNEWMRHYSGDKKIISLINNYPTQHKYAAAINQRIDETLEKFPSEVRENVQLVFSAHGTPVSLVKKGDPYSKHIKETVAAVMKARKNSHAHHLCYQSKVGPMKWLEPATDAMIRNLSAKGKKNLLIIPISFVSDHVETLFELDIEYRHVADECGIQNYIVMRGLNDSTLFLEGLTELVNEEIKKDSRLAE